MNKVVLNLIAAATVALPAIRQIAAQDSRVLGRPQILGISHAAFYVSDLPKARAFYESYLGFASPFSIPRPAGGDLVWIKINDHQSVELFPGSEVAPRAERLFHVAIEVSDAEAMRLYLRARGVPVPAATAVGKIGNRNYFIKDPDGNTIEIVEYLPTGWTLREQGRFLPDSRVATRMSHVGVMIGQLDSAMTFYRDILGFREIWRGSSDGRSLSWVNLQVPDGRDYIEFMLYSTYPTRDRALGMQHICLEVANVAATESTLATRQRPAGSKPPTPIKVGVNGKRQINYFDPDGTRVEVMEPATFDGKLRPPSQAPAPVGEKKPVP